MGDKQTENDTKQVKIQMQEKEQDLTQIKQPQQPQQQQQLSKAERKAIIDQTLKEVTEKYHDVFEKLSKN